MRVSRSLGRWQVVRVDGDLDSVTVPGVRQLFTSLIARGYNRLLVDLDGIGFVDSSGIGVLIGAQRRLQGVGGELRVVASNQGIAALLRVTGLSAAIAVYHAMADAELDLAGIDFDNRDLRDRRLALSVPAAAGPADGSGGGRPDRRASSRGIRR